MVVEIADVLTIETMFGSVAFLLAITACIAGVSWRTFSKWKDKLDAGENIPFDTKFIYQAIGVLIGSVAIAYPITYLAIDQINMYAGTIGLVGAWLVTAGWAYGLNDGANSLIKRIETRAVTTAVKSGKLDSVIQEKVQEALKSNNQTQEQSFTGNKPK